MRWASTIDIIIMARSKNISINILKVKVEFNKTNSPNNAVIIIIKNNIMFLLIA